MVNKILVVDDEDPIRALLCMGLKKKGYSYDEASNATQALDKLSRDYFSLVLLDINMPGTSGTDILPVIKEKYPDISVIMATAATDTSLAIQCMKEGAYDYITKPFDFNSLSLSIDRALDKRRLEIENRDYKMHLEQKVSKQAERIRKAFFNSITSLVYALEARDVYTFGHSHRVTQAAVVVSEKIGLNSSLVDDIRFAGLVHDIGKIGINEHVLNKPGKLTSSEYEHIKLHPEIGTRILEPIVNSKDILSIVKHHHERFDGRGYPDGLLEGTIPIGARIIAVVDSFDAMTSERPYRAALPHEKAISELLNGKGSQFDPDIVDTFVSLWRDNKIENIDTELPVLDYIKK